MGPQASGGYPGVVPRASTWLILGPARRRAVGQPVELFSRMFRREPWWEPVPAGLALAPRAQLVVVPPGPSRFFPVHPGWRHWHPPPGAVH